MNRFQLFVRLLRDRISPPTYPEYQEYRRSDAAPMMGEDDLKLRRLKVAVLGMVVIFVPLSVYIYTLRSKPVVKRNSLAIDPTAAAEVMKSLQDVPGKDPDSVEDIKRWAAEMERKLTKTMNDSADFRPGADMSPYYSSGQRAKIDTATRQAMAPIVSLRADTLAATPFDAAYVTPPAGAADGTEPRPAASSEPLVAAPAPPAQTVAAVAPPSSTQSPFIPLETPGNPYSRRKYDRVEIEPNKVEPY